MGCQPLPYLLVLCVSSICNTQHLLYGWGAYAHRLITRDAILALPEELKWFYKQHLKQLEKDCLKPDKRRYVVAEEAAYHYINVEAYQQAQIEVWSAFWEQATPAEREVFGALLWKILEEMRQLIYSWRKQDEKQILARSADLLHYLADLCTPLHTTQDYDGRSAEQAGVHRLWESELPERFAQNYLLTPLAQEEEIEDPYTYLSEQIMESHRQVSLIFDALEQAMQCCAPDNRYVWSLVKNRWEKRATHAYATAFHHHLEGMVAYQMRRSVTLIITIFCYCWHAAGAPDLSQNNKHTICQNQHTG